MKNYEPLCVMDGDSNDSPTDHDTITCAATLWLRKGKIFYVNQIHQLFSFWPLLIKFITWSMKRFASTMHRVKVTVEFRPGNQRNPVSIFWSILKGPLCVIMSEKLNGPKIPFYKRLYKQCISHHTVQCERAFASQHLTREHPPVGSLRA